MNRYFSRRSLTQENCPVPTVGRAALFRRTLVYLAGLACGGSSGCVSTFHLTSPDLPPGRSPQATFQEQFVANDFGCHGGNESPALSWEGAPAGTKSFAITMYDYYRPPVSGWWHWIVYDLPPNTNGLPRQAGSAAGERLPPGAVQGLPDGDAPEHHYYGPCPDPTDPPHRYVITVYALNVDHLSLPPTATAADVDYAMIGKIIGKASIVRLYQRGTSEGAQKP